MQNGLVLACMLLGALAFHAAQAETQATVLDTWPAGDEVTLPDGQTFYLHLAYRSDVPTQLWVQPYFEGKPVRAGTNPSATYPAGAGQALGWFFLFDVGTQVDEVRIRAGDGSERGTKVVATYPVAVTGGSAAAPVDAPPVWLTRLRERDEAASRAAREAAAHSSTTMSDLVLLYSFGLAVLAAGLLTFVGPAWALWRWRGAWRVLGVLPALIMGFVILRIVIDTTRDPTSHNLWPFEILIWGAPCCVGMVVLFLVHRATRSRP